MKITKAKETILCFEELCIGDFFYNVNNCLCIKTAHTDDRLNAFNLETETAIAFFGEAKVNLVDGKSIEIIIH